MPTMLIDRNRPLVKLLSAVLALLLTVNAAYAEEGDSKALIEKAIKEYESGNFDKAAAILARDLQQNPDDGVTHYYLGLVKKKLGDDSQALNELEWGARLCPPEVIESLAKQALDDNSDALPKIPVVIAPKADFFGMIGSSVSQMFGGEKPKAKVTKDGAIELPPQDLFGSMDDLWKQGKNWVRGKKQKQHQQGSQYKSWAADIMPMGDMLALVDKSKSINATGWASHSDGLKKFHQAPENTQEWDYWIARYKRAFQHILMGYLAKDAKEQIVGSAACIFSIDKTGNLRGHIYASTGDGVLNKCLLKTIQTLNHSRILSFPYNSRITGFNFRMTWNFGKLLHYIRAYRAYKKAIEEQVRAEILAKQAEAKLKKEKMEEARAKAEKLKAQKLKEARARLLQPSHVVKADVMGEILPPARPVELRAVAKSLADININKLPDVPSNVDPFSDITDREIMSWPDMNR